MVLPQSGPSPAPLQGARPFPRVRPPGSGPGGAPEPGAGPVCSGQRPCPSALLWGLSRFSQECSPDKEPGGMQALRRSDPGTADLYHALGKCRQPLRLLHVKPPDGDDTELRALSPGKEDSGDAFPSSPLTWGAQHPLLSRPGSSSEPDPLGLQITEQLYLASPGKGRAGPAHEPSSFRDPDSFVFSLPLPS